MASALLLTACGSGSDDYEPADLSKPAALGGKKYAKKMGELYDRAVQDGQTTISVYGITTKSWAALYKRFSERFPAIKVKSVTIFGPEMETRIDTEIATGKQIGDMVSGSKTDAVPLLQKKQIEKYKPFTAAKLPKKWSDPGGHLFAPSAYIYAIAYNKNEVKRSEVPKSLDGLLDPRWRGQVGAIDLTTGPGDTWMTAKRGERSLNPDWARKFAEQKPVMLANENEVFTAVATGRTKLGYYCWVRGPSVLKDQPVGFMVPMTDGNMVGEFYRGIIKGAPNPDAAKLLENWAFTPEAQGMLAEQNQQGLMPGTDPLPGLPEFDQMKTVRAPDWDNFHKDQRYVRKWIDDAFGR